MTHHNILNIDSLHELFYVKLKKIVQCCKCETILSKSAPIVLKMRRQLVTDKNFKR